MISLIKSGAFDEFEDRKFTMAWYIWESCDKKTRLTLQNMPSLIKRNMAPQQTAEQKTALRIYEFNRYLKKICKKGEIYVLDQRAIDFLDEMEYDNLILVRDNTPIVDPKVWDKVYQKWMDVFRDWIKEDKESILTKLNYDIFMDDWDKYAQGSLSKWEMDSMCYYYHDHELLNINSGKYGIQNFFTLPEVPVVAKTFERGGKEVKIFELTKICGTCIAKNKNKSTVSLLTTNGVVLVKFNKEYFSMFDRQISQPQPDGTKKVIEKSWFNRGNMILVNGMRQGDEFISKKYSSTGGHQLYKIVSIDENGDITLQTERAQGELDNEEN
jgi:DNA polymerase-3 subunit alpha